MTISCSSMMLHCPNPGCLRNVKKSRKPFSSNRGLSIHLAYSPGCKAFVFDPPTISTSTHHFSSEQQVSKDPTVHIFKKQRFKFNPVSSQYPKLASNSGFPCEEVMNDDSVSLSPDDDSILSADESVVDDNAAYNVFDNFHEEDSFFTTECPPTSGYTSYTTSQKCVTSLMLLLDSLECPDYAFEEILNWARTSYVAGFDFNPKCKKRSGNLKWMYKSIHNSIQMLPSLKRIDLPDLLSHASTMDVIYYDFVPQILSLLQDEQLMSSSNLVLDPTNPLAMFSPDDGRLGEALSGSVYRKLYDELVEDSSKQLLCPLICYTDATQIDTLSRFSIEPFLFTIAILSQEARCKASAWRPFGYIQQLRSNLRSDNRILPGAAKARNYHAQLSAMLESLKDVQTGADPRLKAVDIYLFGKRVQVELLCPILLIASDTPAADKLCGHYSSYGEGVQRVTCSCNISFDNLDDPNFPCAPVTWHDMNGIIMNGTDEELAAVSQHKCANAFTDIVISDADYKIYGALPTDTMHALQQRTMSYAMQFIFDCMTAKQKYHLDELAQTFHKVHRQTSRKLFPQTDFSNGVCNLSNMTAAERCGQVFLLVCLCQFDDGWKIFDQSLVNIKLGDVLEALEAMCCFDAWTRLDKFWSISEQEHFAKKAKDSLAEMLTMIRDRLPREKGNGWKLPTFHNLMHIVSDMYKYGKPKEANTEVGEKNHKVFAKSIGRRCRKQHKTFANQVAGRLADAFIIDKVSSVMEGMNESVITEVD